MDYKEILLERQGDVALLTLNRPHIRNALSHQSMIEEIEDACRAIQLDGSCKVLVLTGAGTAFCAGGNVKDMQNREGMFAGHTGEIWQNYRQGIRRVPLALYRLDVPTIAAVNGPAIGAGCDLACMCDIRIASETAKFGEVFASLGLTAADGGAFFLPQVIGFSRACELAFTCRIIDAREALRIGLVSRVTENEELIPTCMELAREIAQQPAGALRMTKRLMQFAQRSSLEDTLEMSIAYQAICHATPEHRAALDALLTHTMKKSK